MAGADKLLGSGDMLYLRGDMAKPVRLQGGYVSEDEVRQVVGFLKEHAPVETEYDDSIVTSSRDTVHGTTEGSEDAMFEEAKQVVLQSGKASASLLQRRLRVGYARAARLLDELEEHGVIGPAEGNKPREILVQAEEGYDGYGDERNNVPVAAEDTLAEDEQW